MDDIVPDVLMMISRLWRGPLRTAHSYACTVAPSHALVRITRPVFATTRTYAAKTAEDADEEELKAARSWLTTFTPESIPKSICEVSFSRSSGPGGQNVNK